MEVNYRAPLIAIREAYPSMEKRGGGAIVNVSSRAALEPLPDMIAYGTSKLALEHLTLDAARELHPKGIVVNCFRIDIPVASEGFVANTPGADRRKLRSGPTHPLCGYSSSSCSSIGRLETPSRIAPLSRFTISGPFPARA